MLKQLVVKIAKLAFSLPKKICSPIPILKQGTSHAVSMTQEQCACILANAFFCTFPHRFYKENSELLPYVNFDAYGFVSSICFKRIKL
jgi:poly(ADP-ribose) glycohydrolase